LPANLVLIEWHDSRQPIPNWQLLAEFTPSAICECVSVGFLIHDGEAVKALAQNLADINSDAGMQASGVIHIPAACITRIVHIQEVEATSSSLPSFE
jgi:hypothetical protein